MAAAAAVPAAEAGLLAAPTAEEGVLSGSGESLEPSNFISLNSELNTPQRTPAQSGSGSTTEKVWKVLKIGSFIILTLLLIIALMPIIPFWVITYQSFWGEFGFLRFIVTKYRNF